MSTYLAAPYRYEYPVYQPSNKSAAFFASGLFHTVLLALAIVGIPIAAHNPTIITTPISVEILDVAELTQTVVSAPAQKQPEKPPEEVKDIPEPPPEKPPVPTNTSESLPDVSIPEPPEPIEEPVVVEEVTEISTINVTPKLKPKVPERFKKKPEVKKEEPKKSLDSVLKNLIPQDEDNVDTQKETPQTSQFSGLETANLADKVTMSEADALKRQLSKCWIVPIGAKNAEELIVEVRITVGADRTVQSASIVDKTRYNRDSHFRAAADAALRSLRNPRCSPLDLPAQKYNQWKNIVITFNPRDMLT